jgi:twitching motility two-component system response regulator PilG
MKSIRVMVIDDSRTIRTAAEESLRSLGHEVLTCTDGFNGISHLISFKPDFVFVDMEMPRMDGLQSVRLIRANSEYSNIPVVMLSSKDGIFDLALAQNAGATDYIVKPFSTDDLRGVIEKHHKH